MPFTQRHAAHTALWVGIILALPLWRELHEPDAPIWNGCLALMLAGAVLGVFLGIRHIRQNRIEVGEARFQAPMPPTEDK